MNKPWPVVSVESFSCPTCWARPGHPCTNYRGVVCVYHSTRVQAASLGPICKSCGKPATQHVAGSCPPKQLSLF